jgi:hypothetical protein
MIAIQSYSAEHIKNIKLQYPKLDQQLIERMIFAFGLLEALIKVGLPFVFKGGTSLMLLLKKPYRISTDIDILVEPNCDVENYLSQVANIYPFIRKEEQLRIGKNRMLKKHHKFFYQSPLSNKEISVLLDILYAENVYPSIILKPVQHEFLLTIEPDILVKLPTVDALLGDKLAAFAPFTTGIPFVTHQGHEKTLEVIKQLIDVSQLINAFDDIAVVKTTYEKMVVQEASFRGIKVSTRDTLIDTFQMCLALISRGKFFQDHYRMLIKGISKVQNHIYGFPFHGEVAYQFASPILFFSAKLLSSQFDIKVGKQELFKDPPFKAINNIFKLDPEMFNMVATAIRMIDRNLIFQMRTNFNV